METTAQRQYSTVILSGALTKSSGNSSSERFFWTLPPEHDEKVTSLLDWIEQMQWPLANFGVESAYDPKYVNEKYGSNLNIYYHV